MYLETCHAAQEAYSLRFFRKSHTKKTHKGLQDQEMVSPAQAQGSILDVVAHDVIETQFVPFQAIKHTLHIKANGEVFDP